MVIKNLDELGLILKSVKKKIGIFGLSTNLHQGHRELLRVTREKSDFVIGIYYNTWPLQLAKIAPEFVQEPPPLKLDILNELEMKCDLVMLYDNGYTSFEDQDIEKIKNFCIESLPDSSIPKNVVDFPNAMAQLRASQIIKYIQHSKINYHIQVAGNKESWRFYYKEWVEKIFNVEYYLIETVKDEKGNIYSSSRPKDLKCDIVLLEPWMRTKKDVEEQIKNIPDLSILKFIYDEIQGNIFVSFKYGNDPKNWWTEGIKINEKSSFI